MNSQTLTHDNSTLLRRALLVDAAVSGLSGAACMLDAWPLAGLMGIPSPFILIVIGLGFVGWAAFVYRIAARPLILRAVALMPVIGNIAWVIASWVLLLGGWVTFTQAGWWIIAVVADIVALFAILQYIGIRQMSR